MNLDISLHLRNVTKASAIKNILNSLNGQNVMAFKQTVNLVLGTDKIQCEIYSQAFTSHNTTCEAATEGSVFLLCSPKKYYFTCSNKAPEIQYKNL